jgi:hypothetical protein
MQAVAKTNYSRVQFYQWRRTLPEFAQAWDKARLELLTELEERARDIALGPVSPQSTLLLMFLMKSIDPERYCDSTRAAKYKARLAREGDDHDPRATEQMRQRVAAMLTHFENEKRNSINLNAPPANGLQ